MKKKISRLASLGLAVLLLATSAQAASFPDVEENAAYAEAAEYLNEVGIMQGDAQGNFNPNDTVTRAQMAAIICRMLGETEGLTTDGNRFTDVPVSYWANGYIMRAVELGIIGGYGDGSFKPGNPVTYEQAVKMIVNVAQLSTMAEEYGGYPEGYLFVAKENGFLEQIVTQKGSPFTRANVAILLFNYYNYNI